MAGKVLSRCNIEARGAEKRARIFFLSCADFEAGNPARRQQPADLGREPPIIVEPVGPCKQRLVRLPLGDVARQGGGGLDIRRVAQDEVEPRVQPFPPIAAHEMGAIGEAQPLGVAGCDRQRRLDTL